MFVGSWNWLESLSAMADANGDADDDGDADPKAKNPDQKKIHMNMGGKKGTLTMGNVSGLKRAGMSRNPRTAQAAADG